VSNTSFTGARSSLRGALHSDVGIRGRCSGCEHGYLDREDAMRIPESAESRDGVHVSLEIGWCTKRIPAMNLD